MNPDTLRSLLGDTIKEDRPTFIAAFLTQRRGLAPHIASAAAVALCGLADGIKRMCELACSQELTPAQEKRQSALEAKFAAIATELDFESRTGGDPRGACAYLIDPNDRKGGDGWGDGWAIYAR